MAWLLLTATAVLAVLVVVLVVLLVRLGRRVASLEQAPPRLAPDRSSTADNLRDGILDEPPVPEFVITQVGEPEVGPVPTVAAPMFADIVARETVIQTASLVQGVRRALAPETRNRIRFQMRQEVKRSRKQRRTELRDVRREWAARQRAAADTPA